MRLLPVAVLIALVACDEASGPHTSVRDLNVHIPNLTGAATATVTGIDHNVMDDPPPEFDTEPAILEATIDGGFNEQGAYGSTMMRFFGNRGKTTLKLNLFYDGTGVGDQTRTGRREELVPGKYRIDTSGGLTVGRDCGHRMDVTADYESWHQFMETTWGLHTDNRTKLAYQQGCPPEEEDGGPNDGGTPSGSGDPNNTQWYICYYTEYYDSETGAYLYTEHHGCEPL